jgi:hypothetical protein
MLAGGPAAQLDALVKLGSGRMLLTNRVELSVSDF